MRRRRYYSPVGGVKAGLVYQMLRQIVPKKTAVLVISLLIGIPLLSILMPILLIYFLNFCMSLSPEYKDANKNIKMAENQLKVSPYNSFSSKGLAQYYHNGIENSVVSDNKLTTNFAQYEFQGDGSCTSHKICKVKFNNDTGHYTIYLINNGRGLIKTFGYSWYK